MGLKTSLEIIRAKLRKHLEEKVMLPLRLVTKEYDKDRNIFTAILPSSEIVYFDPFVSCAIELSDEDYINGKGFEYTNKTFLLTDFSVQRWDISSFMITPSEGGMIEMSYDQIES
jgi:hypothetical protein